MGSTCVILSRSFCNVQMMKDMDKIRSIFRQGVSAVRALEQECVARLGDAPYYEENRKEVVRRVGLIVGE